MTGRLRAALPQERELVRAWRNAPGVRAMMYSTHEISAEEHALWWAGLEGDPTRQLLMFEEGGEVRGVVIFSRIDRAARSADWAFYAAPDAPKGLGSRMEAAALDHAFGAIGLESLACEVLTINSRVIALHERFGFEPGQDRPARADAVRLSLSACQWWKLRPSLLADLAARERRSA
jgi:UDP-4-amino-4,6-dideoxy-N-acetyl-beta-L-altrosamine N-acetyltransferase